MFVDDPIKPIAPQQVAYFGGAGEMVLPSLESVVALICEVPAGRVITIEQLRKTLAMRRGVRGACPITTRRAVQGAFELKVNAVPCWRVVKTKGELFDFGDAVQNAALLQDEGVKLGLPVQRVMDLSKVRWIPAA